jgi:hypothetical protein
MQNGSTMELTDNDLRLVTGGNATANPQPKGEGFMGRELGRIQNELGFGATRGDATREWNNRLNNYRKQQKPPEPLL